ncbi:ATP-binding protein [Vibrio salinus]|uniref:ATP-binding protein n=1 Tax=Vibrio salinus TaxID=2899784 RepID=UPI0027E385ED|nr:ATP-binding protein [Vibrio salinus]
MLEILLIHRNEVDAYLIASYCKKYAIEIGFSDYQASLFNIAVSEIAINAVRHASGANVDISNTANDLGIEVVIEDCGSGIADISKAMQDGYSTYKEKSFGLGLGVALRCADEMIIKKSDNTGTSVILRHFLPVSEKNILVRTISHPAVGHIYNSNIHVVKEFHGDTYFVVLADDTYNENKPNQKFDVLVSHFVDEVTRNIQIPLEIIFEQFKTFFGNTAVEENRRKIGLVRINNEYIEYLLVNMPDIYWLENDCTGDSEVFLEKSSQGLLSYTSLPRNGRFTLVFHSLGIDISRLREGEHWSEWDAYKIAATVLMIVL